MDVDGVKFCVFLLVWGSIERQKKVVAVDYKTLKWCPIHPIYYQSQKYFDVEIEARTRNSLNHEN